MKVFHKRNPVEGIRYDGTVESIQEIRRVVIAAVGEDFVEVQGAPHNTEHIEVDNVVMLDFQRLFIRNTCGHKTPVDRGSWVVSFHDREGNPSQILVMPDSVFHGNFEIEKDVSQDNKA